MDTRVEDAKEGAMDITVENAKLVLEECLKNHPKYEHSIEVSRRGQEIAKKLGYSNELIKRAKIAGLLHDIGKSKSKQEMIELCLKNNLTIYDFELYEKPEAMHGKISELLFAEKFKKDEYGRFEAISNAIAYHVAGRENMTDLDKIVYIADNVGEEKENDLLARILSNKISNLNDCIKEIIAQKKAKAEKDERGYNPQMDATLEGIEEELQER